MRRSVVAAVAALALTASLAGCSNAGSSGSGASSAGSGASSAPSAAASPAATGDLGAQKPHWRRCGTPSVAQGGGPSPKPLPGGATWQCATMAVPLDYAHPSAGTVPLALIRAKAADTKHRIGSLVFNFGGPGGSGVTGLPSFAKDYEKLRSRYDLVSFDPRGVGDSDPVECESNSRLDTFYAQDATPDTAAERKAYAAALARYAAACQDRSPRQLPHVGTTEAARDMDLLRQVLGEKKLDYFGISYGTELGGVYAHLFPTRVGRTVFDGVVDPTQDARQGALGQAKGFQLALDNFAKDCVARGDACRLPGSTPQQVEAFVRKLLAGLDGRTITGIGVRRLTQTEATNGVVEALYSKDFWPLLEQGLDEAHGGNGALLLALSDSLNGRDEHGRYSNTQAANAAVNCLDSKQRFSVAQTQQSVAEFRKASPVFGDLLAWGMLSCTKWPVAGRWTHPDVSAPGAGPILVVGNTGDPATPYEGAKAMERALGKGVAVELTYEGQGHGAYDSGNACVQRTVNAYFLNGTVPKSGTVCR
ncbi:alpha/beta hydrolase [Streptomyces fuscigenes]|uniref:alpha/beta hydrolase n=1 Tax=Streptomyces fuscigenes TaxID=1528880 RepID=UPI001F186978|nr:alpha/beta hydrolase [Streptomyces fuscigenes]MCF3962220.1 alpha/beta hydrolase [Streptomyces fuscigenes]